MSRFCASVGRAWLWLAMPPPPPPEDGPVGGLKGLEVREGEPEADEVDWALGPVGMPLLGPPGVTVGEPVWVLPEME